MIGDERHHAPERVGGKPCVSTLVRKARRLVLPNPLFNGTSELILALESRASNLSIEGRNLLYHGKDLRILKVRLEIVTIRGTDSLDRAGTLRDGLKTQEIDLDRIHDLLEDLFF